MALHLLENLGAKFSEDLFYANKPVLPLYNNLKQSIRIILLCLQCSLSNMHGHYKEKLCIL